MRALVLLVLVATAVFCQTQVPLDMFNQFLDGFHFQNGDLCHQVEARHYCNQYSDDLIQCVIMDRNNTRLMGVEYIVTEEVFKSLPEEEKRLWHSHVYEVKSGMLIAPDLSQSQELELMKKLISTYGKTWHTFEDGDLPLGIPQLMMGFTEDGQLNPNLLEMRDKAFNIDSQLRAQDRRSIVAPAIARGADAWMRGLVIQLNARRIVSEQDIHWSDC